MAFEYKQVSAQKEELREGQRAPVFWSGKCVFCVVRVWVFLLLFVYFVYFVGCFVLHESWLRVCCAFEHVGL